MIWIWLTECSTMENLVSPTTFRYAWRHGIGTVYEAGCDKDAGFVNTESQNVAKNSFEF